MITLVVMHPTKINARKKFKSRLVNTNQGDFFCLRIPSFLDKALVAQQMSLGFKSLPKY
jgi:hypothetical protein